MSNRSNVTDCYNRGVVYSKGYSGGIVGIGDNYKVTRCYVKAPEKSTVAKGKYGIDCSSGQAGGLIGNSKDLTLERCFWYSSCAKVAWGQYSLSGTHSGNDYDYYYYQVRFKNPDNFPTYDFKNVWYIDTTSGADAPGLLFETTLKRCATDLFCIKSLIFLAYVKKKLYLCSQIKLGVKCLIT